MDNKALFTIGYGLYVLTTNYDGVDNGCIVNTVMQYTDRPLRIGVTVNKANYTHDLIKDSCVFNVSMLTTETPMSVIEHFGFQSGRKVNKFAACQEERRASNHVLYIPNYTNAYLACHVVHTIDFETHTLFIAEILDAEVLSDKPSLTYDYYQKNIKAQRSKATDSKPSNGKRRWMCTICGWIYEGDSLPDDIVCEICKHGKESFEELTS